MKFQPNDRVIFIPHHADGNFSHPDVVSGQVSSIGNKFVFVKFDKQVAMLGWDGTTSQACDPLQLRKLG